MTKTVLVALMIASIPGCAFAVDGVTLINQATVNAAGGFPYFITQPGSYKLSGNLTVTSISTIAILIGTNYVTLDLNGFTISGPGAGTAVNGSKGILSDKSFISIKNGFVTGFQDGVELSGTAITLVDLQSNANFDSGFTLVPNASDGNSVIVRCTARSNGVGFFLAGATVSDSNASTNGGDGFVGRTLTLTHNIALRNGGFGLDLDSRSVFGSNTIVSNQGFGTSPGDINGSGISQNNNVCTSGAC